MIQNHTNPQKNDKYIFKVINRPGFGNVDHSESNFMLIPKTFVAPLDILFEVSTICNFTCLHCYNMSHPEGTVFDDATFNRLTDEIIALQPLRCCLSGGEPFIFSDRILTSALKMRRSGILTSTITNGWLITPELVPAITESFVGIQVSIDGPKNEIHDRIRNKEGSFECAVNALHLLSGNVAYLQVASVATSLNYRQMPDLASLLIENGISQWVIQPMIAQGRAVTNPDMSLSSDMFHKLVELIAELRLTHTGKLRIDIMDPVQSAKKNLLPGRTPNQQMYISSTGDILCIPFLPIKVGNCLTKSLQDIWHEGLETYYQRDDVKEFFATL